MVYRRGCKKKANIMQTSYIRTTEGFRLHARRNGTGDVPIIFLHGFPFDSTQWLPQLEELADMAVMLAPDLRGLGRSEGPAEPGEYSLGIWADDARAWLDELGWERAVVAGLSMGGYTAFEFARRYPERLAALILLDTHPRADEPDTIANRRRSQQIVAREGVAGIADGLLERVLGRRTRQLQPGIVADVRRMMHAAPVAGVVGALEAMARRSEATSLLSGITVPVLVAAGEDDLLTPPARTQEWAHRLPDAVIATIPEAGHVTSLEAPGAVNAIIRHFVEGLEPIG